MTRALTPEYIAAATAPHARYVVLVEIELEFDFLRLALAPKDYLFAPDGGVVYTFTGSGALGNIEPVAEGQRQQDYAVTLTLTQVDPEILADARNERFQGKPTRIWFALLDDAYKIIPDPMLVYAGRNDTIDIAYGRTGTIALTVVSRMSDWERAPNIRWTDEQQRARFPDDTGLRFIARTVDARPVAPT